MSSEQPLHVIIRVPCKRPQGFVEPPSVVWTEEMEQKLWEILAQNKRQSIDWNAASRLLNVPVPYLLRHAAFLYETQLRGVQMQLRRGEALSASNSVGNIGNRNRASSRASLTKVSIFDGDGAVTGNQRPPSAMSNASREQYIISRGGHGSSQEMIRTESNTNLTDGRKQASGSASSSINASVAQSANEAVKNVLTQTQTSTSPIGTNNTSGRQTSPSSSALTITTDQVTKQSTHITHKQDYYSTTNLSTIESSSTNESFVTPAASMNMPLSRTLSNHLPLDAHEVQDTNLDNLDDSDDESDSLKKSDDDLSERLTKLTKLQDQDLLFLPNSESQITATNTNNPLENNPVQQPLIKGLTPESLSTNSSSSFSDTVDSLTQSELENAYLDEASNFNGSKTSLYSIYSVRKS